MPRRLPPPRPVLQQPLFPDPRALRSQGFRVQPQEKSATMLLLERRRPQGFTELQLTPVLPPEQLQCLPRYRRGWGTRGMVVPDRWRALRSYLCLVPPAHRGPLPRQLHPNPTPLLARLIPFRQVRLLLLRHSLPALLADLLPRSRDGRTLPLPLTSLRRCLRHLPLRKSMPV